MGVTVTNMRKMTSVHIRGGAPSGIGGSLLFTADTGLSVMPSSAGDLYPGTGDFTIEWFQFQHENEGIYSRVFSQGGWPNAYMAVSMEPGGDFYLWGGQGFNEGGFILHALLTNYSEAWVHFAVVRQNDVFTVYQNGVIVGSVDSIAEFGMQVEMGDPTGSTPLVIGNDLDYMVISQFSGNITNFRMIVGEAVYTTDFTPPTAPLTMTPAPQLLLTATSADQALTDQVGHTVTQAGGGSVTWDSSTPF